MTADQRSDAEIAAARGDVAAQARKLAQLDPVRHTGRYLAAKKELERLIERRDWLIEGKP